jgi:oxaloacetate decarboxylase gamma subunit
MEEINVISEAFKFMLLGMGVVFLFLFIMIWAIKLQVYLINKFLVKEEVKGSGATQLKANTQNSKNKITAVITAAILHNNNQKG